MKLSRRKIPSLLDALMNMEGPPANPSKFTPKVRYALAKNVRLLNTRFEDMEKARSGLIRQLAPVTLKIEKDTPESIQFSNTWEAFLDAEEEDFPGMIRFTVGELNLDVNSLPIVVLAKLGPILIEDADPVSV
jgi:hypothetical protein